MIKRNQSEPPSAESSKPAMASNTIPLPDEEVPETVVLNPAEEDEAPEDDDPV